MLQMKEEDVLKFLAAGTHLGGTNMDFQMEQYVYKRKSDGQYLNTTTNQSAVTCQTGTLWRSLITLTKISLVNLKVTLSI